MEVNETLMYEVNWSHFVTLIVKDFFADRYHLVPTVESRRRRAGIALGQQFGELVFFPAPVSYTDQQKRSRVLALSRQCDRQLARHQSARSLDREGSLRRRPAFLRGRIESLALFGNEEAPVHAEPNNNARRKLDGCHLKRSHSILYRRRRRSGDK